MTGAPSRVVLIVGELPGAAAALEGLSCAIACAASPAEAAGRCAVQHPDLILCDYPALDAIRAASPATPIVVLAHDLANEAVFAAMEKAFACLTPPFEPHLIREVVLEALESADLPDSIQLLSRQPDFIMLRLRCSLTTANRFIRYALQLKTDLPLEDRRLAAMAVRELLLNAIEHGGKLDPEKWVNVCRVRTRRTVIYHIQDPGEGFTRDGLLHAAISNPEHAPIEHMRYRQERGMRSGGFGILLARRLVDEVIYSDQGNSVVLIKHFD